MSRTFLRIATQTVATALAAPIITQLLTHVKFFLKRGVRNFSGVCLGSLNGKKCISEGQILQRKMEKGSRKGEN